MNLNTEKRIMPDGEEAEIVVSSEEVIRISRSINLRVRNSWERCRHVNLGVLLLQEY